ncbi:RHS repeat-associated core domain-containing protein [Turneriella parva DSM 21527]|uniref:RHS repeat-associated core domain-containing protein n=2 Tax=Turneriella TaxID=338321 RepID=I4B836_TURPD|nr:RHS repeat-associated core domain-containing protein [Turneriella parva DSM 21527]
MAAKVVFSSISSTMLCMRCLLLFILFMSIMPVHAGVNPDGSFSETLPIEIPVGRNGVQPQLALTYNSNAGNGIVGVGFSLQGLPAITRISYGRGINYDGQDTYVGPEGRLVPLPTSPTSGGGVYHAENETWSKYEPLGNDGQALTVSNRCGPSTGSGQVEPPVVSPVEPCQWRVTDRSGVVYSYGANSQSRALAIDAAGNPLHSGAVRQWALTRVTDLNGNYYEVEYYQNAGQIYPKRIRYTYGPGASKYYTITFAYDESSRPDKEISYASSSFVQTNWRLREVLVDAEQPIWWIFSWTVQVRRYELGYDTNHSNTSSELASWSVTAGNQVSTTQLRWLQESQGFETSSQYSPPWVQHYWGVSNGVQGDYVDFDGDGLVDFLLSFRDLPGNNYQVAYRNTGHGWVQDARYTPQWIQHFWGVTNGRYGHYVDITGDGLIDYVVSSRDLAGNVSKIAYINTRNGWQLKAEYTPLWVHAYWGVENGVQGDYLDFDGDGLTDYVVSFRDLAGQNYTAAYRNNGHGWVLDSRFAPGWIQNYWGRTTTINSPGGPWLQITGTINGRFGDYIDVNADGLPDFIASSRDLAGNVSRLAYINTGSGWLETAEFTPPWIRHYWGVTNGTTGDYLDVNGDGLPDYVASFRDLANNHSQTTWLNTGRGWRENTAFRASWTHYYWAWECATWCHQSTAAWGGGNSGEYIDINGDGRVDYVLSFSDLPGNNTVAAWINTNAGWTSSSDYVTSWIHNYWGVSAPYGDFVDFNGDYVPDYMISSRDLPGNIAIAAVANRKKIGKSLLQEILSPTGTKIIIQYKTATKLPKAICTTACTGPQGEALGTSAGLPNSSPRYLVTEVTTTGDRDLTGDGVVDSFTTRYEYYNGRVATGTVAERASLGFEKIVTRDVNSGNYKIDTYRQDKPFQGYMSVSRSYLADNTLVSEQYSPTTLQQYYCSEVGCSTNAANDPTPSSPRQIRATGESETRSYENGILIGRKFQEVLSQDIYGSPLIMKTGVTANGTTRTVYKFIQYINENTATNRALGVAYSEKTCYTATECATGDNDFISESRISYDGGALGTIGSRHLPTKRENYVLTGDGVGVWLAEQYTYDTAGNILTHLDARGFLNTIVYDPDYNQFPVSVTKSHAGKSSTVTAAYDPRYGKKILETIVDEGTTITTNLDATGFVTQVTVENGSTTLAKNSSHRAAAGASPIWGESCTHFGAAFTQSRCTKNFKDAMGRTYREEYPELVNGVEKQMAIEHKYDSRGRAVAISQPFDATSGSASQWSTRTYDIYGRVVQAQSFDGKTTSTVFQTTGLPAGIVSCTVATDTDGKQQQACNNIHGKAAFTVESYGAPEATRIDYIYDGRGRLAAVTAPQGITTIGYVSISGIQAFVDDPISGRTDFTYYNVPGSASFGQLASETRAGKTTSFEYSASFGRMSKITRPDSVTTFTYDETDAEVGSHGINKPTTLIHQVNGYTLRERYRYNAKSDITEMKRWISHATETLCSDPGAMPCFQRYAFSTDNLDRAETITYPDGNTTELTYVGATEHVAEIKHAGLTFATYSNYTYDVMAHIGKVTYGNGLVHDYTYQPATGVMQTVSIGKANQPEKLNLTYAYDASFNISSITDNVIPDLSVTYQYDVLNRIRQSSYGSGKIRDFRFDQDGAGNSKGNLLRKGNRRMTYAVGKTYPVADELYNETTSQWEPHQTMTWSAAGSLLTKGNFSYEYDSNQMMTKAVEANTAETEFVYDHTGQRFLKKHTRDGVTIKTWYVADGLELREKYVGVTSGNPPGIFDSWQATKYIYGQDRKRIASITGNVKTSAISPTPTELFALAEGYSASTFGGMAMKTYYTFYGIYAHENLGRVLRIILLSALALVLLLWLYYNSLSADENFGGAFFRRLIAVSMITVFVSVNCGQNAPPTGVTPGQISTIISELYTGLPAGTVYYSHNHLGSGSLVTDTNGDEIFRITYTEYGEIDLENSGKWNSTTQTLEQNMSDAEILITAVKFTGQEYDPETGFYYYNARYYSAELGVFTTSDTEFDSGSGYGFNRHMYVGGNPIMASDPSGHFVWFIVAAVVIGAIMGGTKGNPFKGENWKNFSGTGALIGALAGLAGALTGGAAAAGLTGLNAAVVGGMAGGAAGGFVGGAGTAWANGASFGDGLLAGFAGGVMGAIVGAAAGAAFYGAGQLFGGSGGGAGAATADAGGRPCPIGQCSWGGEVTATDAGSGMAAAAPAAAPSTAGGASGAAANAAALGGGTGGSYGGAQAATLVSRSNSTSKAPPGKTVYGFDQETGVLYPTQMGRETFASLKDYCWSAPYDSMRGCSEPGITSAPVFPSDWLPFNLKSLFKFGATRGARMVPQAYKFGKHVLGRMESRGVNSAMVDKALRLGKRYYDPKNKTTNFVLSGGFASGKDLLVGVGPTGTISTVIRGSKLVRPRFVPIN